MIELTQAWQLLDALGEPLDTISMSTLDALGRTVVDPVESALDLPPFDNSAMDGYAIRSADVVQATEDAAVSLAIEADTFAGDAPADALAPGAAVRIMTGAPVPPGADCVLRLEDGRLRGEVVEVRAPVPVGRHIRRRGEDVGSGDVIVDAGHPITVGDVGILAAAGVARVRVVRPPSISVLVTGSELVPIGEPLHPGAIHDSNGPVLESLARGAGISITDQGIVGDDRDELRARIDTASRGCDVLVVSGGVSVGRRDYVKRVLDELSAERLFWRVRMKPGKPLLCARLPNDCIVLGLPGNPVSALAGWTLFVEPLLRRLGGDRSSFGPQARMARLRRAVGGDAGRVLMATARRTLDPDGSLWVEPTDSQGSAMMRSMVDGNCFMHLAIGARLEAGEVVPTYSWSAA